MKILRLENILQEEKLQEKVKEEIQKGSIFVYPTDTVYGLGCDALNAEAVKKIREIKGSSQPFSVITPSKEWINQNLFANEEYMKKLPGPFTLIFKKKRQTLLAAASMDWTLGVRIPYHPLTEIIQQTGRPFITTSANISGDKPIGSVQELSGKIRESVDFIIDGGLLCGKPSAIFDLTGEKPKRIR
jgi:tRNA threonylcarbamoyl adenosine modification protein (Sua5/YciO/YrdC/YwlC family)